MPSIIEILPATSCSLVNKASPLKVKVLRGSRSTTCVDNHPNADVYTTDCTFRFYGEMNGKRGFTSDPFLLPQSFEACYKFLEGTSYQITLRKSVLSNGKCEFWILPDCPTKVLHVYSDIRQRRHKVSIQSRKMASIKRRIGYRSTAPQNRRLIYTHVCNPGSADCSPVQSPVDPDQSNLNDPEGSPHQTTVHNHNVVPVPAFVQGNACTNVKRSLKRLQEDDLLDSRPMKVARTDNYQKTTKI